MFDYLNFIEALNRSNIEGEYNANALNIIKKQFHIGKFEIKDPNNKIVFSYVVDNKYKSEPSFEYIFKNYLYLIYTKDDGYEYTNEDIKELYTIIRIIALHYVNFVLTNEAKNAELISSNTRLPNTHGFMNQVGLLLRKNNNILYNAYFINIKGFGIINKLFGQAEGDKAIISYANKLKDFIEDDEVVGHLGGDNFVALIKRDRHKKFVDLATMCPIEVNFSTKNNRVNLIGVVGYYEVDNKTGDYRELMSNSSMACQFARSNKKIIVKYTSELENIVNSVKIIERTFKEELEKGSFVIYYQPKFDIKTGKIIGVEALSRWVNNGQIVPPGMFVPILEKNGEIIELDLYVLENLCRDIHNYRNLGHNIVPASCNLSRRDFENDNLEEIVINIIRKYNVKTEDIVIEVTETTNIEEKERLSRFINTMSANGILTSIDDFGTGYSSLSVLRDFKVSEIKIDRSFINRDILSDSDEIIIGSIIDMAKRLNINVICEGVETEFQAEFLTRLGCNNAQGFLYSKPLPKLEFEALMQKIGTIYDK